MALADGCYRRQFLSVVLFQGLQEVKRQTVSVDMGILLRQEEEEACYDFAKRREAHAELLRQSAPERAARLQQAVEEALDLPADQMRLHVLCRKGNGVTRGHYQSWHDLDSFVALVQGSLDVQHAHPWHAPDWITCIGVVHANAPETDDIAVEVVWKAALQEEPRRDIRTVPVRPFHTSVTDIAMGLLADPAIGGGRPAGSIPLSSFEAWDAAGEELPLRSCLGGCPAGNPRLKLQLELADTGATKGFITVYVKTLTGETLTFTLISTSLTVEEVKQLVSDYGRRPDPNMQRLIFAGKQLEDGRTLADYNIPHEGTLHVIYRLKGGKPVILFYPPPGLGPQRVRVALQLSRDWELSALVPLPASQQERGQHPHPGSSSLGRSATWEVEVQPGGSVVDPRSGREWAYLFWEALTLPAGGASGGAGAAGGEDAPIEQEDGERLSGDGGTNGCSSASLSRQSSSGGSSCGALACPGHEGPTSKRLAAAALAPGPQPPARAPQAPWRSPAVPGLPLPDFEPAHSFCVAREQAEAWLHGTLTRGFGLPVREATDMITYWLPQMEERPATRAYLITFAAAGDYEAAAALSIAPAPASVRRVFMMFESLASPSDVLRCMAEACGEVEAAVARAGGRFRRSQGEGEGMSVLEWGGMEVVRPQLQ